MVNTAVFYYDFKGKQEQVYKFDGVTNTVTQNYLNVGNAEIYGIEAELLFQPSRRWDFNFSGGWLHGKITKSETILQDSFGANILLERSDEHTSELQSLMRTSYAVFSLTNKKRTCNYPKSTRPNDCH